MRRRIALVAAIALLATLSACKKPDPVNADGTNADGSSADEVKAAKLQEIDPATGLPVVKDMSPDPAAPADPNVAGDVTPGQPGAEQKSYGLSAPKIESNVADLTTPTNTPSR